MKRIVILLLAVFMVWETSFAQKQDTVLSTGDTLTHTTGDNRQELNTNHPDTGVNPSGGWKATSGVKTKADGQIGADSTARIFDSTDQPVIYTEGLNPYPNKINRAMRENEFINTTPAPEIDLPVSYHESSNIRDIYFYVMCALLLVLGIFRISNRGYIFSLFSVYFNTSLKQNQLTERLIQAKLSSFILNLFFVIVTGAFAWLVAEHLSIDLPIDTEDVLFLSLAAVGLIYLIKFLFFKFFGWISGFSDTINRYLFIVFLINKIIGIILIPFVILLLFGKPEWADTLITIGSLSAGFLLLSRYFRGYLLLKKGFVLTPFHFILFIIAVEVIPLLLIYKAVAGYL